MSRDLRFVDAVRRRRSPLEVHLIDGLVDGRIARREFLRHGSLLGLSLPLLGGITASLGLGGLVPPARAAAGGTLPIGQQVPAAAVEPVSVADAGGLLILQQVGEFLTWDGPDLVLRPQLAETWSPNQDGTVWTFKLRRGVKFHGGRPMTADDVVATFDRLSDPANSSNALSVFHGLLSPGGARKVDDYTVEFHLEAANGSFPYMVSSDNYNAIILPADYAGDFEQTFNGTGPFKLEKFAAKVGASFVRNDGYWGPKALPDRTEFTFFADIQPQILALQGGQIDVISQLPVLAGVGLLTDPNVDIIALKSVAHQQVHMRCDMDPFQDARVRRAIALCLDRPRIVQGLMKGKAAIGNDSPFAAAYPTTDPSVPQRGKTSPRPSSWPRPPA